MEKIRITYMFLSNSIKMEDLLDEMSKTTDPIEKQRIDKEFSVLNEMLRKYEKKYPFINQVIDILT